MTEGPGGGGGGGGDKSEDPASVQKIEGEDAAKVAVEVEAPEDKMVFEDPDKPPPEEEEKEVVEEEEVPAVVAPVVETAPDDVTERGAIDGKEQLVASAGPGTGEGMGEGEGSGIGEGTGGGIGGGVYRPGSGITPPIIIRQVRPNFTEDALARKIQGEVEVEVVILKDGTVRPVRVLRGLTADLNEKALAAASQWKFIPAKFKGQPVDLIGEHHHRIQHSLIGAHANASSTISAASTSWRMSCSLELSSGTFPLEASARDRSSRSCFTWCSATSCRTRICSRTKSALSMVRRRSRTTSSCFS